MTQKMLSDASEINCSGREKSIKDDFSVRELPLFILRYLSLDISNLVENKRPDHKTWT